MEEATIKQIMRGALFNAHNTHGHQAPGDRLYVALDHDQGNVFVDAIFEALKRAGVLDLQTDTGLAKT
ncbi:MAG: hypothetical protein WDM94_10660 [Bauldia sp.]